MPKYSNPASLASSLSWAETSGTKSNERDWKRILAVVCFDALGGVAQVDNLERQEQHKREQPRYWMEYIHNGTCSRLLAFTQTASP